MPNNIILIGFMGSGKTTVGTKLSYRKRVPFYDTDKLIEQKEKRTISDIFAQEGEEAFRKMETALLQRLTKKRSNAAAIFSVGGGTPLREENRSLLHKLGKVIYLKVKPETVYERLKNDTTRPLLQGKDPMEKIQTLMEQREEKYLDVADMVLLCDDLTVEEIVEQIINA